MRGVRSTWAESSRPCRTSSAQHSIAHQLSTEEHGLPQNRTHAVHLSASILVQRKHPPQWTGGKPSPYLADASASHCRTAMARILLEGCKQLVFELIELLLHHSFIRNERYEID